MSRSIKKGPLIKANLDKKVLRYISEGIKKPVKIYNKALMILPHYENMTFMIHNGKKFINLVVRPELVGCRFGEFCKTRIFSGHKEIKNTKTKEKSNKK
jgi:small subunit ribosomal protein S19